MTTQHSYSVAAEQFTDIPSPALRTGGPRPPTRIPTGKGSAHAFLDGEGLTLCETFEVGDLEPLNIAFTTLTPSLRCQACQKLFEMLREAMS